MAASGCGRRSPMPACPAHRSPPSLSRPMRHCCCSGRRHSTPSLEHAKTADGAGGSPSGSPADSACSRNTRWPIGCSRLSAMSSLVRAERRHICGRCSPQSALRSCCIRRISGGIGATGSSAIVHVKDNAGIDEPLFHPDAFLEFFGSQFAVFGPLLFAGLIVLASSPRTLAEPRARLLAAFALPTLAMMLAVSFLSRANANWAAPAFVSATVLVVAWALSARLAQPRRLLDRAPSGRRRRAVHRPRCARRLRRRVAGEIRPAQPAARLADARLDGRRSARRASRH